MELPPEYRKRMKILLGDEYADYENSFTRPRRFGLRVNTLKVNTEQFLRTAPFHLTPVPWVKEGYYYEEEDAVSRHPFYYAGLYYLQEPSAMTPASVLDVEPGMRVLDLCAAPGGKATALGGKLKGEGLLVANDISASRCRALLRNIELAGIPNAFVTNASPELLKDRFQDYFDRILVDAPCSGEGMFRKDESVIRAWDSEKPARCAAIQKELLRRAAEMLRPGGKLLYSTCTFSTLENEEIIEGFLRDNPDFCLLSIPYAEGFSRGMNGLEKCVRLWPHRIGGEGHFMALLSRKAEKPSEDDDGITRYKPYSYGKTEVSRRQEQKPDKKKKRSADRGSQEETAESFFRETGFCCFGRKPEVWGSQVYFSAIDTSAARGIPFLRNGVYLGEIKKDRFEPSQSFALAWNILNTGGSGKPFISLPPGDQRIRAYLHGEVLEEKFGERFGKGWKILAAGGYPLGWVKAAGSQLKNKYPPAWRI